MSSIRNNVMSDWIFNGCIHFKVERKGSRERIYCKYKPNIQYGGKSINFCCMECEHREKEHNYAF